MYIDIAKFIGMMCIILAHVSPPPIVGQIRNFDVPLMVIISGILAVEAYERMKQNDVSCAKYIGKRFIRLVLPTWVFLVTFVAIRVIFSNDLSVSDVINSFLLGREGVGYVWVIMVYLICAILVPLLNKVNIFSLKHVFIIGAAYLLYEAVCTSNFTTTVGAIDDILLYIVPYGILTLFGMNYEKISKKARILTAVCVFVVCVGIACGLYLQKGQFIYTQEWKYPARIYYLSYAVSVSIFVLELLRRIPQRLADSKFIRFVSGHSLWIYLWHILMLWVIPQMFWPVRFVLVFISSCAFVFLQDKLVCFLEKKSFPKIILNCLKG